MPADPRAAASTAPYVGALHSAPLAQSNDPSPGIAGLPDLAALGNGMLLGQTATPALPGTDPGAMPNPQRAQQLLLLPQNLEPSAPGQGQIFGVDPGQENADIKRSEYLHRLWAMYQAGGLDGALLGQRPASQPEPLPPPPPG